MRRMVFKKKNGKTHCVVCGLKHTMTFPEDFPDNLKLCCHCRQYADSIIFEGLEKVLAFFKKHYGAIERFGWSRRAKKIEKLVSIA